MTAPARRRQIAQSVLMVGTGGVLSLASLTFQAVAARGLATSEQGLLAVLLGLGAYAGQLMGAWVVDARLATPGSTGSIPFPRTLALAAAAAAAAVVLRPENHWAVAVGAAVLIAALIVGRLVAVTEEHHSRELLASMALGGGIVVAAVQRFEGELALEAVAVGCLVSVLLRFVPVASPRPASGQARAWVTAEAALTGAALPAVNALLLALVGPSAAVAFRALSTVSAAVEPALSYARTRLLVKVSPVQVGTAAGIIAGLIFLIITLHLTGILSALLGAAWSHVTLTAVLFACLWRAAGLLATIPFAALRRRGATATVFWLRAASSGLYVLLAVPSSLTGKLEILFGALLVAEITTVTLYSWVARRAERGRPEAHDLATSRSTDGAAR